MKEKVKKISKYAVNILNMINMLLLGLANVWNWNIDRVSATIIVIAGVISAYLTTGKIFSTEDEDYDEDLDGGEW
jgi:hypothetical protein